MTVYTIVLRGCFRDEDAMSWVATSVDTDVLKVVNVQPSAFKGNYIVRLESAIEGTTLEYTSSAFEGSLNYEVNDPVSDVVWWNKQVH